MADFCKQCSIDMWGKDTKDLANLGVLEPGTGHSVICEGCGFILVDESGNCIMCDLRSNQPGHGDPRFVNGKTGLEIFRETTCE